MAWAFRASAGHDGGGLGGHDAQQVVVEADRVDDLDPVEDGGLELEHAAVAPMAESAGDPAVARDLQRRGERREALAARRQVDLVEPAALDRVGLVGLSLRDPAWRAPMMRAADVCGTSMTRTFWFGAVVPSAVPV